MTGPNVKSAIVTSLPGTRISTAVSTRCWTMHKFLKIEFCFLAVLTSTIISPFNYMPQTAFENSEYSVCGKGKTDLGPPADSTRSMFYVRGHQYVGSAEGVAKEEGVHQIYIFCSSQILTPFLPNQISQKRVFQYGVQSCTKTMKVLREPGTTGTQPTCRSECT